MSVLIPAFNAERSIGRAIRSALAQSEVAEVIVIDDCSSDETAAAARAADDGSKRLRILRNRTNIGPAASRNRALDEARSDYIALLDSDDFLLDGRFSRLMQTKDWDAVADDICFAPEGLEDKRQHHGGGRGEGPRTRLELPEFIDRNIPMPGRARRELGFMKPLIRRQFLVAHGLRFDERLRLGEDYILYAQMLAAGARFFRAPQCGYVAVERAGSLSGNHSTQDLEALLIADRELAALAGCDRAARDALRRHQEHLERRVHHRRFLDAKRRGLGDAIATVLTKPLLFPALVGAILRDKLRLQPAGTAQTAFLYD